MQHLISCIDPEYLIPNLLSLVLAYGHFHLQQLPNQCLLDLGLAKDLSRVLTKEILLEPLSCQENLFYRGLFDFQLMCPSKYCESILTRYEVHIVYLPASSILGIRVEDYRSLHRTPSL